MKEKTNSPSLRFHSSCSKRLWMCKQIWGKGCCFPLSVRREAVDKHWQLLPRSEPANSLYLWSWCIKPLGFEGKGLQESTAPFLRCLKSHGDFQTVLTLMKKGRNPRSMQHLNAWETLGFSFLLLWVCVAKCILMQGVDRNKHDVLNDLIRVQRYLTLEDYMCGHTKSIEILEQFKMLLSW